MTINVLMFNQMIINVFKNIVVIQAKDILKIFKDYRTFNIYLQIYSQLRFVRTFLVLRIQRYEFNIKFFSAIVS